MQKHHKESLRKQVQLVKEQEEMAKKQDQANAGIASLLDMMKKQQKP
jgi:predicted site-specific integrase-resolvase